MRHILAPLLALAMQAGAAAPPAHPPAAESDPDLLLTQLASPDAAMASRAEAGLVRLGPRATPALAAWLAGPRRDQRAAAAVLRVIARVKDPGAMRALWAEWEHEASRDALIDTWAAFGDACVSPLAGYYATATTSQQEKIIDALGRIGLPAVPALKGLRNLLAGDQSSLADRIGARIDLAILKTPAVTLSRKGRVAWRDLESMAGDPATPEPVAQEAVRGLAAILSEGDEAAQALQRLAAMPLTPELHAVVDPAADDARLLLLARKGEDAIPEYAAIARDGAAREALRMGAVNALFGLGPPALGAMEKLSAELPSGSLSGYVKELTATLRAMPASPRPALPKSAAPAPPPPPASPCLGDAAFTLIARISAGGMPISPRWFRRSSDGRRLVYTTVEVGLYRLVTAAPGGEDSVTVAPLAHQFAAAWSPDGRRLAFLGSKAPIAGPVAYNEVYVANPDGTSLSKITSTAGAYASPVWLPQGGQVLYAANELASPQTGGAAETSSILYRCADGGGGTRPVLMLSGRIITAIEPSPDGRQVAFLSWKSDGPDAGALYLHVTDPDGVDPREVGLAPRELVEAGGRTFDPKEALALGGDLTWTAGGTLLTAAGRVVEPASLRIRGRIDPDSDAYATRTGSRTLFVEDGACAYFDDTRQIMRRCPPDRTAQPVADCHGALLWLDAARGQVGLFDALDGMFGVVRLARPRPVAP